MAEPKWTPGPWRKLPGKHSNHYVIVAGDYADEGEPDLHVEVVTANPADANIIAAAPDLYEACEEALRVLEVRGTKLAAERMAVRMLTRALRKARGEDG